MGAIMLKRWLTAIPAIIILAALIYFHGWYLLAALWIVSLIAQFEMINAVKRSGIQLFPILIFTAALFGAPVYVLYGLTGYLYLLSAFILAVCIRGIFKKELAFKNIVYSFAAYIYPQIFFVFLFAIAWMPNKAYSQILLIFLFAAAILTDTFAYFTGLSMGKHKLAPVISPNKTVEGAAGGVLGGMLAAILTGCFVQNWFGMKINIIYYLLAGLIMSVLSQLGDLMASLIKREFGIKDYGKILPGHGGIMDRLDSILFIAPVIYIYFTNLNL